MASGGRGAGRFPAGRRSVWGREAASGLAPSSWRRPAREGASRGARSRRRAVSSRLGHSRPWPVGIPELFAQQLRGLLQDVALGLVRGLPARFVEREPANFLHLVVVSRDVAARRAHEVEADGLADALPLPYVEVGDVPEVLLDFGREPRFLLHLADGRVRWFLVRLDLALGKPPRELPPSGPAGGQGHLHRSSPTPVDHPAGGTLGAGPHGPLRSGRRSWPRPPGPDPPPEASARPWDRRHGSTRPPVRPGPGPSGRGTWWEGRRVGWRRG